MRQVTLKICALMLFTGLVLPGCSSDAGKTADLTAKKSASETEESAAETAGKTVTKTTAPAKRTRKILNLAKTPSNTAIETSDPEKTPDSIIVQKAEIKLPVPDQSLLQTATNDIKEVYGLQFYAAKTNEKKLALANRLYITAHETKDNPARLYVLLRISRDIAAGAGELETAMKTIDKMAQKFHVDAVAMKSEVLLQVAKATRSKDSNKTLATHALVLTQEAISQDKYELARQLIEITVSAAREARETKLVNQAVFFIPRIEDLEKQYLRIKPAFGTLKTNPTDPDANLTVGKFRCFYKGDWKTGLPMLARGSDAHLKELATLELKESTSETDQLNLGHGWWDLGVTLDGTAQNNLKHHAAPWYRLALWSLEGIARKKVEKRLAELGRIEPSRVTSGVTTKPDLMTTFFATAENYLKENAAGEVFSIPLSTKQEIMKLSKPGEESIYEGTLRTLCYKQYKLVQKQPKKIYAAIQENLVLAERLLSDENVSQRRKGVEMARQAALCALERLHDKWLASNICTNLMLPNLDAGYARSWEALSKENILTTACYIYGNSGEDIKLIETYKILLSQASSRNTADAVRLRLAQALERQGKFDESIRYLKGIDESGAMAGARDLIPALEKKAAQTKGEE